MAKYEVKPIIVAPKVAALVSAATPSGVAFDNVYNPPGPNNTVAWELTGYSGPFFTLELTNIQDTANVEETLGDLFFGGLGPLGGITFPATFNGFPVLGIVQGDGSNEKLFGGSFSDDIYGRGGSDRIDGYEGADYLDGGGGEDSIYGGDGDDSIDGGAGADYIEGDDGNDTILGGGGGDTVYGDAGDDCIDGGDGGDDLYGGAGNDYVEGGAGNDDIFGDGGNDILLGEAGEDNINGGGGNDIIDGGAVGDGENDDDTMIGGGGKDRFVFAATSDTDTPETAYTGDDLIKNFAVSGGSRDQIDLTCLVDMEYMNVDIVNKNTVVFEFWDRQGATANDGDDRYIGSVTIKGGGVGARADNSQNYGFDGNELFVVNDHVTVFGVGPTDVFIV